MGRRGATWRWSGGGCGVLRRCDPAEEPGLARAAHDRRQPVGTVEPVGPHRALGAVGAPGRDGRDDRVVLLEGRLEARAVEPAVEVLVPVEVRTQPIQQRAEARPGEPGPQQRVKRVVQLEQPVPVGRAFRRLAPECRLRPCQLRRQRESLVRVVVRHIADDDALERARCGVQLAGLVGRHRSHREAHLRPITRPRRHEQPLLLQAPQRFTGGCTTDPQLLRDVRFGDSRTRQEPTAHDQGVDLVVDRERDGCGSRGRCRGAPEGHSARDGGKRSTGRLPTPNAARHAGTEASLGPRATARKPLMHGRRSIESSRSGPPARCASRTRSSTSGACSASRSAACARSAGTSSAPGSCGAPPPERRSLPASSLRGHGGAPRSPTGRRGTP